jgi:hypothetical protein
MQKGFAQAYLLIAILVVVLGAGAWYYTKLSSNSTSPQQSVYKTPSAPNQDANLETYTNDPLHYSIQYPADWKAYSMKDYPYQGYPGVLDPTMTVITNLGKFPKYSAGDGSGDLYYGIDISKGNELYRDITTILKRAQTPDLSGSSIVTEISLNNIKAYRQVKTTDSSNTVISIYIPNTNSNGVIVVSYKIPGNNSQATLDQILSTFKFSQ